MGVPGSKIWSNLQLLSLFQSKYLKCGDCYDDNDGSQGLRVGSSDAGDVIKTSTKAKKNMKREKYENKRKHRVRIVIQTAKNVLYADFLSKRFHSNYLLFLQIFSARSWRKFGHLMEKWQDVSRGEKRGHSRTPRQLTTGSATVSDLTHDLNVKMAGMI